MDREFGSSRGLPLAQRILRLPLVALCTTFEILLRVSSKTLLDSYPTSMQHTVAIEGEPLTCHIVLILTTSRERVQRFINGPSNPGVHNSTVPYLACDREYL